MAVYLSLFAGAGQQFFTNAGVPLAGGKIYTYGAGGSTPQATYTTSAGNIAHSNPIVLDAAGRVPGGGEIWLTDTLVYKFQLETSTGTIVQTLDNVSASIGSAALAASSGSSLIGFIQAGSGPVATTVQAKLREWVSVKDFGATGSGTGNDSTAIQAAIDYAKTNSIGTILFPAGNYRIASPLYVRGDFGYKGIELRGENATITMVSNDVAMYIDPTNPSPAPEYRIRALVHGFYFNGPGVANTASVGIQCQNGANIEVRDCIIRNFYRGLYGSGCLISRFENLSLNKNFYGIQFENTVTFAPNDVHFHKCYVWDNTLAVRCINFPNGAMTFISCEIEGNNLAGNTTDGRRVTEFFNAGKVTLLGCHFEANPGQYNIYYDGGSTSCSLSVIGCEIIPGDDCGNVLYMANATSTGSLFVEGSRVTNNVGSNQIVLTSGIPALVIGETAGNFSGSLDNLIRIKSGKIGVGGVFPSVAGIRSTSAANVGFDCEGVLRFIDSSENRLGFIQHSSTAYSILNDTGFVQIGMNTGARVVIARSGGLTVEANADNTYSLGTASYRWQTTYTTNVKLTPVAVAALPAAGTIGAGARAFVNDANATTFASVVAGGGANNVPVYSDGTNWRIG